MTWMEKDLDMMMRSITSDIIDVARSHATGGMDAVLKTDSEKLKVHVAQGMKYQIGKFH